MTNPHCTAHAAPGARVVVRDAEWVVRRVDPSSDGGYQLVCDGVSELVREREAVFLTTLEPEIQVLDHAVAALDDLKARQLRQLELRLERSGEAEAFKRRRKEQGRREIDTIFDEYLTWIEDTMTTEAQPWIKVVCVSTVEG